MQSPFSKTILLGSNFFLLAFLLKDLVGSGVILKLGNFWVLTSLRRSKVFQKFLCWLLATCVPTHIHVHLWGGQSWGRTEFLFVITRSSPNMLNPKNDSKHHVRPRETTSLRRSKTRVAEILPNSLRGYFCKHKYDTYKNLFVNGSKRNCVYIYFWNHNHNIANVIWHNSQKKPWDILTLKLFQ